MNSYISLHEQLQIQKYSMIVASFTVENQLWHGKSCMAFYVNALQKVQTKIYLHVSSH